MTHLRPPTFAAQEVSRLMQLVNSRWFRSRPAFAYDPLQDCMNCCKAGILSLAHDGEQLEPEVIICRSTKSRTAPVTKSAGVIPSAAARFSIWAVRVGTSVVKTAATTPGRFRLAMRSPSIFLSCRYRLANPRAARAHRRQMLPLNNGAL
jgi:hypothetical protein